MAVGYSIIEERAVNLGEGRLSPSDWSFLNVATLDAHIKRDHGCLDFESDPFCFFSSVNVFPHQHLVATLTSFMDFAFCLLLVIMFAALVLITGCHCEIFPGSLHVP